VVEHLPFKQVADGSIPSTLRKFLVSQQVGRLLTFILGGRIMKKFTCHEHDLLKRLLEIADIESGMKKYLEAFYYQAKVRNLSEKTMQAYGERLGNFYKFLRGKNLTFEAVDKCGIQDYILSMKDRVSDETVNGRIRVLKTFFKFLVDDGLWDGKSNPMDKISLIKTEKRLKPILSPDDITKLLSSIDRNSYYGYRAYCMILIFWDSLIRLSELANLRVASVDLKTGTIKVYGKGRKERICPLGSKTVKHLHRFWINYREKISSDYFFCDKRGKPLQKRNVERILTRIGKRFKMNLTPHLLRHSGASFLALTGVPAFLLQKLLGHTTLSTTNIYINLQDDERLKQAFQKYSPADSLAIA